VILHITGNDFWKSTPRKIGMLWNEYLRLNGNETEKEQPAEGSNIVYRDGKPYRKAVAKDADWAKNIF
jgi:hypothetical protein